MQALANDLADLPEVVQGVNAGVMAVGEGDVVGIVSQGLHARDFQWSDLGRCEQGECERVFGLGLFFFAGGARAGIAEQAEGIPLLLTVAPSDLKGGVFDDFKLGWVGGAHEESDSWQLEFLVAKWRRLAETI